MAERHGRKRHGPDQIITKLRETDAMPRQGPRPGRFVKGSR